MNKEENQNFLCWKKAAILILGLMLMSSLVAAAGDRFEQKLERVERS
jgi:hypothetical protein